MANLKDGVSIDTATPEPALYLESRFGKVSLLTHPAPIENRINEDACGARELSDALLLVVADGLGGHKNGSMASEIVINNLVFSWSSQEKFSLGRLVEAVETAHEEIKALKTGAGSTAVVTIIDETTIRFLSVGDSSGYLFSGQKNFKFKTLEHSPTGLAVEAGLLNENEAMSHEESHVILNALGHEPLTMDLTGPLEFSDRDYALLATDGLTANLLQEEFTDFLANKEKHSPLDNIAQKVRDKMLAGGHPDDLSLALFMK